MSINRRIVGISTLVFLLAGAVTTVRAQSDGFTFSLLPSSKETAPFSGEYNYNYDLQLVNTGDVTDVEVIQGESFTIYNVAGYVSANTGTLTGPWSISTSTPGVPPSDAAGALVSIDPTATSVTFTYTGSSPIVLAAPGSVLALEDLGDFTLVSTTNVVGIGQYTDLVALFDASQNQQHHGSSNSSSTSPAPDGPPFMNTLLDYSNIPSGQLFGTQFQIETFNSSNHPISDGDEGLIEAPYDPNVVADILSNASVPLPPAACVFVLAALAAAYSAKRFARGLRAVDAV